MVPTIVGLAFVTIGLLVWVVWLTIKLYEARGLVADTLDAHTVVYMKLTARVKAVEARQYPKYLDAVVPVETAECGTPDPVWGEHDTRVKEALTQAMPARGAIVADPNEHPFFTVTPDQSADFDNDTAHRLTELGKAIK